MADIQIKSLDGKQFSAYCATPAHNDTGPGLIVLQEIFGVNQNMRNLCEVFASQGFIAVCPDLFWRQQPDIQLTDQTQAEWEQAFSLMKGFDPETGVNDILSTIAHLRSLKNCNGLIGVVGYCLGGKMAYMTAARCDVDATVSYYGVGLENMLGEIHDIRTPTILHIAELDSYVPTPVREKILKGIKRNPEVSAYVYEGVDHAFARINGKNYNKEAADLANERTMKFFREKLMGQVVHKN